MSDRQRTILVTGADGFIGRNLCATLAPMPGVTLLKYDIGQSAEELAAYAKAADFVIHLAGVNRPQNPEEFQTGNAGLTSALLERLKATGRPVPFLLSSSTQAALDNPYGVSKRAAEEAAAAYAQETGSDVFVFRLPNVFGKWCRPNYNSAVATWCHNIARGLPVEVRDPQAPLTLVYVDDVVDEFLAASEGRARREGGCCVVPVTYRVTLGDVVERLTAFKRGRVDLQIPDQADAFTKKLYATYLSYLPTDGFQYPLKMNVDARGSFTEALKSPPCGQVSVNVSKPGITKGNHWHHTKCEKFLVVSGQGAIRFRRVGGADVYEYLVSGDELRVVDIPPGYTHHIENLGGSDLVTLIWANESLDPNRLDTFYEKV